MPSLNPYFTIHYDQPPEYHFSHDSVFLARKVFELVKASNLNYTATLDLCSGSGIVGLDFIFHLHKEGLNLPLIMDFIEVQNVYHTFFTRNVETLNQILNLNANFNQQTHCQFINKNYQDLITNPLFQNKYDLIICNPPYFSIGHGAMSPSQFKNRCRFYMDSTFKNLIMALGTCLSPGGRAYVLIKSLHDHGIEMNAELSSLGQANALQIKKICLIRKTDLYEIKKRGP